MTITAEPVVAPPPLRRNLRFQMLWIGMTTSSLGVSVADIAYPLAILAITGSPARAGLFAAVQVAGGLLAGLPAGSLTDRYSPRTVLIAANACRAAVTILVAIALISGWLSLPLLLTAAVLLGAGSAISSPASMLLLRSVVPNEQLNTALTQDQVRTNGAQMAGPPLGGALYAIRALAHAVPFLFTAATFIISVFTAFAVKPLPATTADAGPQSDAGRQPDGGMLAGLRTLWSHPLMRPAILLILLVNTVGAGLDLVVIVLLRNQGVPSAQIGIALGIWSAGGIAGIPLVKTLHRLRPGVVLLIPCLMFAPVLLLLTLPFGPWWVAGIVFTVSLGIPAALVALDIVVIRQAPAEQRGRVVAAAMTLMGLGMPAGMLGCGLLLQYLPARTALLVLAAFLTAGLSYCATKRALWQTPWPAHLSPLPRSDTYAISASGHNPA
jgi:predicted MFS family arabinose efflux permease